MHVAAWMPSQHTREPMGEFRDVVARLPVDALRLIGDAHSCPMGPAGVQASQPVTYNVTWSFWIGLSDGVHANITVSAGDSVQWVWGEDESKLRW